MKKGRLQWVKNNHNWGYNMVAKICGGYSGKVNGRTFICLPQGHEEIISITANGNFKRTYI